MRSKEEVRRKAIFMIENYGIERATEKVDYFESIGIFEEDFANAVNLEIAMIKKRKKQFTKYKKFHPYQTKVI